VADRFAEIRAVHQIAQAQIFFRETDFFEIRPPIEPVNFVCCKRRDFA
jgi:hypothetical protein